MRKARRPAATALALALALQLGAAVPAVAADSSFRYGDMTSVAVSPDSATLAAALQAEGYNDAGRVALFTCNSDGTLTLKGLVETGVQPDMVTFADNDTVLTADEGEPGRGTAPGSPTPRVRSPWWMWPPSPAGWWALTPLTPGGMSWPPPAWC